MSNNSPNRDEVLNHTRMADDYDFLDCFLHLDIQLAPHDQLRVMLRKMPKSNAIPRRYHALVARCAAVVGDIGRMVDALVTLTGEELTDVINTIPDSLVPHALSTYLHDRPTPPDLTTNLTHLITASPPVPTIGRTTTAGGMAIFEVIDGRLMARGPNRLGELGVGHTRPCPAPTPVQLPDEVRPVQITSSHGATLLRSDDGGVFAWGDNRYGQLGVRAAQSPVTQPTRIGLQHRAVSIVTGDGSSFIRLEGGQWVSSGLNDCGQLHHLHADPVNEFSPMADVLPVTKVHTAGRSTWFWTPDDRLFACGANDQGQLGVGTDERTLLGPDRVRVPPTREVYSHDGATFFVLRSGELMAVGANTSCQLGLGHNISTKTPSPVALGGRVSMIYSGSGSTIARVGSGWVGWGLNGSNQLMEGAGLIRVPAPLALPDDVRSMTIAFGSTFVVTGTTLQVRGLNSHGQLGLPESPVEDSWVTQPLAVPVVARPAAIGGPVTFMIRADGVQAFGDCAGLPDTAAVLDTAYLAGSGAGVPPVSAPPPPTAEMVEALQSLQQTAALLGAARSELSIDEFRALRSKVMGAFALAQQVTSTDFIPVDPAPVKSAITTVNKAAHARSDAIAAGRDALRDPSGPNLTRLDTALTALIALQSKLETYQRPDVASGLLAQIQACRDALHESLVTVEETEAATRGQVCLICCDGQADHAFVPCGHRCVCETCSQKTSHTLRKCPICRLQAEKIIRIYNAGLFGSD